LGGSAPSQVHLERVKQNEKYPTAFRTKEMIATSLGRALSVCIALAWFLRVVAESVYFGYNGIGTLAFALVFGLIGVLYLGPLALSNAKPMMTIQKMVGG
jgi:preprotein translocase subunit SecF